MKPGIVKYILTLWFSLLLLLGNTPMEFVHLFADHKDTIHHDYKGLVIEQKHHHCAFLSLTLTSFINDYSIPYIQLTKSLIHQAVYLPFKGCVYTCPQSLISLRGPPVA